VEIRCFILIKRDLIVQRETKPQRWRLVCMDIVKNLVTAADPTGLAIYVAVVVFFLGTVALARFRDEAISARKARRWYQP
jgi:hypothetical protein